MTTVISTLILYSAIPTTLIILTIGKGKPAGSIFSLIIGLALTLISASSLFTIISVTEAYSVLLEIGKITPEQLESSSRESNFWQLVIPFTIGAIGANYLTSWFQSPWKKTSLQIETS